MTTASDKKNQKKINKNTDIFNVPCKMEKMQYHQRKKGTGKFGRRKIWMDVKRGKEHTREEMSSKSAYKPSCSLSFTDSSLLHISNFFKRSQSIHLSMTILI